jgi:hypothetical protein
MYVMFDNQIVWILFVTLVPRQRLSSRHRSGAPSPLLSRHASFTLYGSLPSCALRVVQVVCVSLLHLSTVAFLRVHFIFTRNNKTRGRS